MAHLVTRTVAEGDFLMVPAGEIHAVGPGVLIYEVQQSSDITYRLHDFDRTGPDGAPRELHLDEGLSVATAPSHAGSFATAGPWQAAGSRGRTQLLVDCPEFTVRRWEPRGDRIGLATPTVRILTVVGGSGTLYCGDQRWALERGSSLVIPEAAGTVTLEGDLTAITSDPHPPRSKGVEGSEEGEPSGAVVRACGPPVDFPMAGGVLGHRSGD